MLAISIALLWWGNNARFKKTHEDYLVKGFIIWCISLRF